ncbi:MAG: hypothetical protein LBL75_00290 [Rickettsiales bacterium]|jgi:hypothetical protein|nr:hypothetical protein [Rickettsiales bacterium]
MASSKQPLSLARKLDIHTTPTKSEMLARMRQTTKSLGDKYKKAITKTEKLCIANKLKDISPTMRTLRAQTKNTGRK